MPTESPTANERLNRHLFENKLSPGAVALAAGISAQKISDLRAGRRRITPFYAAKIAMALDLPLETFLDAEALGVIVQGIDTRSGIRTTRQQRDPRREPASNGEEDTAGAATPEP